MAIETLEIILLGLLILTTLLALTIGLRPWRVVAGYDIRSEEETSTEAFDETFDETQIEISDENSDENSEETLEDTPILSVVVYGTTDGEALQEYIDELFSQDYRKFEVVLVCVATSAAASVTAEQFEGRKNLHITFVSPDNINVSQRKLANTIGIKAARGKIILTTTSNTRIPSSRWLSEMARPFEESKYVEVVLGYTHMDFKEFRGVGRYYRQFDSIICAAGWLYSAIRKKAWRGDGANLAFSRRLFFDNKGYARTINLHNGDDDLFVDEICKEGNTRVVLSKDSILTTEWGESAARVWTDRKERRNFTGRWLPLAPRLLVGRLSLSQWLIAGLTAILMAVGLSTGRGLPGMIPAAASLIILLTFWIVQIYQYRRLAKRLEGVKLSLALPLFLLWHPIGNAIFKLRHYRNRFKNFTWQRH